MHAEGHMKKLILIPTIVMTAFLALAFVAPAAATGMLRTVAPASQAGHVSAPAVQFAIGGTGLVSSAKSGQGNTIQAPGSSSASTSAAEGHSVSTAGHSNCGRFGDGFHGGKHDFICPNRPFPAAAS
jgi:hypothetical protein